MSKSRLNKNALVIIYKLANDLLFIALAFLFLGMISDSLLPGIVSSRISFTRIILFISLNLLLIYFLANISGIRLEKNRLNKKTALLLLSILILLIFNSLFKLNIILSLSILFLVGLSGYFIYKVVMEDKSEA